MDTHKPQLAFSAQDKIVLIGIIASFIATMVMATATIKAAVIMATATINAASISAQAQTTKPAPHIKPTKSHPESFPVPRNNKTRKGNQIL